MKLWIRVSLSAIVFAIAVVVRPGTAEQGQEGEPPELLNQIYPGPLGMANFRKIIGGELTGDYKRDALLFDGSRPVVVFAPETFDNAVTVVPFANDAAILSVAGQAQDYILTANSDGLLRHRRNSAAGTWDTPLVIRGPASAWAYVMRLAVANLDNAYDLDIVGVTSTGTAVTLFSNSSGTYTTGPSFPLYGSTIADVWPLNWRDDTGWPVGAQEVAFNTEDGIEIYTVTQTSSAFIDGIAWSYAPIRGCVIRDKNTLLQRIAFVTKVSNIDRLTAFGDAVTEAYVSIGATGTVSMAAGDADSDGDDDVFLSITSAPSFHKYKNRKGDSGNPPTFGATEKTVHPFGPAGWHANLNQSGLAPGDWDSDGKLDVLCPAQGDTGPAIVAYGSIDLIRVENPNYTDYHVGVLPVTFVNYLDPQLHDKLRFWFSPPNVQLPFDPATEVLKLDVKFYETAQLGAPTYEEPFLHRLLPFPTETLDSELEFDVPLGYDLETSTEMYSAVVRQKKIRLLDGEVLDISPAMTGIFTPEPGVNVLRPAPNTRLFHPTIRDPHTDPVYGGMDVGPPVPAMDPDVEPQDDDKEPPPP